MRAAVSVLYLCVLKASSTEPVWIAIATTYAAKTLAKTVDACLQPSIVQVKDLKPLVCPSCITWLVPASQEVKICTDFRPARAAFSLANLNPISCILPLGSAYRTWFGLKNLSKNSSCDWNAAVFPTL